MVTETMLDRDAFARWFGQYASAPKYPDLDWRPDEPIAIAAMRERLAHDPTCAATRPAASRSSASRTARCCCSSTATASNAIGKAPPSPSSCARETGIAIGPGTGEVGAGDEL